MRKRLIVAALAATALVVVTGSAYAVTSVVTANGTWTANPGQTTTSQTAVQQPINTDGSSNFKANGKAVIPIKFALTTGAGPFAFQSILSNNPAVDSDDSSSLYFNPDVNPTLAEISKLIANYDFTTGDCAGGSLRWTLYLKDGATTRPLDVHYQPGAGGIGQQICAAGTSGKNMADTTSTDPYVVIQPFNHAPYTFSSAYNVTYGEAVNQLGALEVLGMNLIVDSGWAQGDQVVDLDSATVEVAGGTTYTETFTPQAAGASSPTCDLPTNATIKITKTDGSPSGDVNEPISIQPTDSDGIFRVVDCKLMYNLATSSLSGVGTYTVSAVINGTPAGNPAVFDLK